ncbi:MAG TPA: kynureninase, partial [Casimicrobiaceae bacterium]
PVITGWFSEFTELTKRPSGKVEYGPGPARFAGATYDYTSHYRAAAVFKFFEEQRLTPEKLRQLSQHQVKILAERLGVEPGVPFGAIGGFLAHRTPQAARLQQALRRQNVWTDYRGDLLRVGPAPYVTDGQLDASVAAVREAAARLA